MNSIKKFCGQIFDKDFFITTHRENCKNFIEISSISEQKLDYYDTDSLIATKNNTLSDNNNILTTGGNYFPNINYKNNNYSYQCIVRILEVEYLEDENNNNYYEYLMEVKHDNKRILNMNKKFFDFVNLHFSLLNEFNNTNFSFPDSFIIFTEEFNFEGQINGNNIKLLENYLNEIGNNKIIIASNVYRDFFGIQNVLNNNFDNDENNWDKINNDNYNYNVNYEEV